MGIPGHSGQIITASPARGLFFAIFLVSFGALLGPSPVYGQACGDIITTDTVLTADLGPCPGDGLIVVNPVKSVTLDLNGFTIKGSGGGIGVRADTTGIHSIQGPGTITNFRAGIALQFQGTPTVQGLTLTENVVGITVNLSNFPRIINNTIDGGAFGRVGISVDEVGSAKIKGNVISGHSFAGIIVGDQSRSVIVLNSVKRNGTGLIYRQEPLRFLPIAIRDNEFSENTQDGVSITQGFTDLALDLNTIMGNGGNGISLSGVARGRNLIQDNVVDDNASQGIALASISEPLATDSIQITDNEALRNALDLFWDGTGTNNCWRFNTFDTSDPATLPCPPRPPFI